MFLAQFYKDVMMTTKPIRLLRNVKTCFEMNIQSLFDLIDFLVVM